MTVKSVYHPGGWLPDAPMQNLARQWDLTAGTYTDWDKAGNVVEQRPLTDDETAELTALGADVTATVNSNTLGHLVKQTIRDNDTYLALSPPSADDQTAQIRRLTRQVLGLAKWVGTSTPSPEAQDYLSDITDVTTA